MSSFTETLRVEKPECGLEVISLDGCPDIEVRTVKVYRSLPEVYGQKKLGWMSTCTVTTGGARIIRILGIGRHPYLCVQHIMPMLFSIAVLSEIYTTRRDAFRKGFCDSTRVSEYFVGKSVGYELPLAIPSVSWRNLEKQVSVLKGESAIEKPEYDYTCHMLNRHMLVNVLSKNLAWYGNSKDTRFGCFDLKTHEDSVIFPQGANFLVAGKEACNFESIGVELNPIVESKFFGGGVNPPEGFCIHQQLDRDWAENVAEIISLDQSYLSPGVARMHRYENAEDLRQNMLDGVRLNMVETMEMLYDDLAGG